MLLPMILSELLRSSRPWSETILRFFCPCFDVCFLFCSDLLGRDPHLLSLVRACMTLTKRDRLTAVEALVHPFFDDLLR